MCSKSFLLSLSFFFFFFLHNRYSVDSMLVGPCDNLRSSPAGGEMLGGVRRLPALFSVIEAKRLKVAYARLECRI